MDTYLLDKFKAELNRLLTPAEGPRHVVFEHVEGAEFTPSPSSPPGSGKLLKGGSVFSGVGSVVLAILLVSHIVINPIGLIVCASLAVICFSTHAVKSYKEIKGKKFEDAAKLEQSTSRTKAEKAVKAVKADAKAIVTSSRKVFKVLAREISTAKAAVQIQSVMRGKLGKVKAAKVKAAVQIQSVVRGKLGKVKAAKVVKAKLKAAEAHAARQFKAKAFLTSKGGGALESERRACYKVEQAARFQERLKEMNRTMQAKKALFPEISPIERICFKIENGEPLTTVDRAIILKGNSKSDLILIGKAFDVVAKKQRVVAVTVKVQAAMRAKLAKKEVVAMRKENRSLSTQLHTQCRKVKARIDEVQAERDAAKAKKKQEADKAKENSLEQRMTAFENKCEKKKVEAIRTSARAKLEEAEAKAAEAAEAAEEAEAKKSVKPDFHLVKRINNIEAKVSKWFTVLKLEPLKV